MAIQHLGLVTESSEVPRADLMKVSAALQKQSSRDVEPIWGVSSTVDPFDKLEDVPDGYWPMIIMDDIGFDGAAGIHLDRDGQPFALITADGELDTWSLTASHEMIEMLVDPFGKQQVTGDSPKSDQGRVSFLVEACDPSEAADFAYSVNGILVSDFYTPNFFDPVKADGVRYSFTGAIPGPRTILKGGYLSWTDPVSRHLWQQMWPLDAPAPDFFDRGPAPPDQASLRIFSDSFTGNLTAQALRRGRDRAAQAGRPLQEGKGSSSYGNAQAWRAQISEIVARRGAGAARKSVRRKTRR